MAASLLCEIVSSNCVDHGFLEEDLAIDIVVGLEIKEPQNVTTTLHLLEGVLHKSMLIDFFG